MTRWKVINKALDLPYDEPQETYSTSEHLFHDQGIPPDAKGRVIPAKPIEKAPKPEMQLDDRGGGSRDGRGGGGRSGGGRGGGGGRQRDRQRSRDPLGGQGRVRARRAAPRRRPPEAPYVGEVERSAAQAVVAAAPAAALRSSNQTPSG